MKIHVISESQFLMRATGVHTAFVDHVSLLKENNDLEVVVNEEGEGDIFHGHTYGLYYLWKGRKYRGRRVFTVHVIPDSIKGSLPVWQLFMPFVRAGLKLVYSYADVCIAISPMVKTAIKETGANTKILSIYNPVHPSIWKRTDEKRKNGRKLLGLSDDEFVVIGVGQLLGRKGVDDFIDISEAIPELKFLWIGGRPFGPLTEGIQRINERIKNAGNNFRYAGSFELEQMPEIYASADLMLFTSFQENSPLAPIEAIASGIPVIFRDLMEYRSLYEYPYIKASDKTEFIELTKQMYYDKEYYSYGLKLSEQLLNQFDRNNIRQKLIDLYKELLNSANNSLN